jgi:hypothetical protein
MPTDTDNVCLLGQTGSGWHAIKTTFLTHTGLPRLSESGALSAVPSAAGRHRLSVAGARHVS